MKKLIAIFVLACTLSAATVKANVNEATNAFIQPFDQSYALSNDYLWYTDSELTNPTGSYCTIWYEMECLRNIYPGYSFSHEPYAGLYEFEYGFCSPYYYATIYSNLNR